MKIRYIFVCFASISSLTSCFQTRQEIAKQQEASDIKQSMMESVQSHSEQLAELQNNHVQLLEKVEKLEFQTRQAQRDTSARTDLSQRETADRTTQLETRLKTLEENNKILFDEIKSIREERLSALATPAAPSKRGGSDSTPKLEELEKLVSSKDYQSAIEPLRRFLKTNPQRKERLKAQFLLGESLYRSGEYSDAILSFSEVHEKNPASSSGRRSTLRIAESFKKMGKTQDAKIFAQFLLEKYPDSVEAKSAQKLLR